MIHVRQNRPLTFALVATHGTLGTINQSNAIPTSITYTPNTNYCGQDSFTFKVNDGELDSEPAAVSITVGTPYPPLANNQDVMTGTNQPVTFILSGSDSVCNETLSFAVVSGPAHGTLGEITQVNAASGLVTYIPDNDFEGTDEFDFTVSNCKFSSLPAPVTINVVPGPGLTAECLPHSIVLNWALPEWLGELAAEGYIKDFRIYRCSTPSGTCTPATNVYATVDDADVVTNRAAWRFVDTNVEPNMAYCYRVTFRHRNACCPPSGPELWESPYSNTECSTTCCPPSNGPFWTDYGTTAQELAEWLSKPGDSVANVTYSGAVVAKGIFGGGLSAGLPFDRGIILSSGNIHLATGPNDKPGAGVGHGLPGDRQLDALLDPLEVQTQTPLDTVDAAVLEFDLTPSTSTLQFDYIFASEEYPEYVAPLKNDTVAIFVNGQNIAWIPGTSDPVCVFTVNSGRNPDHFQDNPPTPDEVFDLQYDGFTSAPAHPWLNASTTVQIGVPVRVKIVIADEDDAVFDSAVFIRPNRPMPCDE